MDDEGQSDGLGVVEDISIDLPTPPPQPAPRFALDIGGTLTKLVYYEDGSVSEHGTLHFVKFLTKRIEQAVEFTKGGFYSASTARTDGILLLSLFLKTIVIVASITVQIMVFRTKGEKRERREGELSNSQRSGRLALTWHCLHLCA
jgi:hypothetical protein